MTRDSMRPAWHRRAVAAISKPFSRRRGKGEDIPSVPQVRVTNLLERFGVKPEKPRVRVRSLSGKLLADCDPLPAWSEIVASPAPPSMKRRAERMVRAAERRGTFRPIPPRQYAPPYPLPWHPGSLQLHVGTRSRRLARPAGTAPPAPQPPRVAPRAARLEWLSPDLIVASARTAARLTELSR